MDTAEHDEGNHCPSQEDINEGICIDYARVTISKGFLGTFEEDGVIARMLPSYAGRQTHAEIRREYVRGYEPQDPNRIAEAQTEKALFKKLNIVAAKLCCPRVFHVNDHGNVTEYDYSGKVIGEWV